MLLVIVRRKRIACDACPVYAALKEDGDLEHFERNCRPAACELKALTELPRLNLWRWYVRLMAWQKAGVPIDHLFKRWSMDDLDAWCVFTQTVTQSEDESTEVK